MVSVALAAAIAVSLVALQASPGGSGGDSSGSSSPAPPNDGKVVPRLKGRDGTETAAAYLRSACSLPKKWVTATYRGWRPAPARTADLISIPFPPNYMGTFSTTAHSGPYDFLQKVPLVLYGPRHIRALGPTKLDREVTLADIAPTFAEMLDFDFRARRGSALKEALVDASRPPKLILTVTIDGGGWNVLRRWPESWPELRSLMEEGTSIKEARVGSYPSVTPPIHANISTGTFPVDHGAMAIAMRSEKGMLTGAFSDYRSPSNLPIRPTRNLRLPTIGDLWDKAMVNRPEVGLMASGNYVLGMLGRGSAFPGGDKDLTALLGNHRKWYTDPGFYSLPAYVNAAAGRQLSMFVDRADRSDGRADDEWRDVDLSYPTPIGDTPVLAPWQTHIATRILAREGYGQDSVTDLFYIQYKSPDRVGHRWNMDSPEMSDVLLSVDSAIGKLVGWLDREIGRNSYVLLVTADHGQTSYRAEGWPIKQAEVVADIQRRFDHVDNNNGLTQDTSGGMFYMDAEEMSLNEVSPEAVASFLTGYTIEDNVPDGEDVPDDFSERRRDRIYRAVIPGRRVEQVVQCAGVGIRD